MGSRSGGSKALFTLDECVGEKRRCKSGMVGWDLTLMQVDRKRLHECGPCLLNASPLSFAASVADGGGWWVVVVELMNMACPALPWPSLMPKSHRKLHAPKSKGTTTPWKCCSFVSLDFRWTYPSLTVPPMHRKVHAPEP